MLVNLKKALDGKNITLRAYAAFLGVSEKTIWNKLNEETPFTYPEVRKTRKELLPEYATDFLFKPEKEEK